MTSWLLLVSALRPEDHVALMQASKRVELIQGWSRDRAESVRALRTKLLSGKRSALADGVARAAFYLQEAPAGNRHLVNISDGLDSGGGHVGLSEALKRLAASGVTVHVISCTRASLMVRFSDVAYGLHTKQTNGCEVAASITVEAPGTLHLKRHTTTAESDN